MSKAINDMRIAYSDLLSAGELAAAEQLAEQDATRELIKLHPGDFAKLKTSYMRGRIADFVDRRKQAVKLAT